MILYHGSTQIINEPAIIQPDRKLDYGFGFYTTTSEEQAERWVKIKIKKGTGYVNAYEFEWANTKGLKIAKFETADEKWVDFVHKNRTDDSFSHDFDIVYGPIADDQVYTAFSLYEQGFLSKEELIKELKTFRLKDQLLFHTEKSLTTIKFIKATKLCLNEKPSHKKRCTSSFRIR